MTTGLQKFAAWWRSLLKGGTPAERARWDAEEQAAKERQEAQMEAIADWVQRKGLITPALIFAEGFRPLAWIMAQRVHFLSPFAKNADFIHPFLGSQGVEDLAGWMENPQQVNRFIDRLEELSKEEVQHKRRR